MCMPDMKKASFENEKNKVIRIKDIALKAQVSTGTVDRVIHNRGRVAEDVKERVLKIIKDLNYEPNLMARMLGSKTPMEGPTISPIPRWYPTFRCLHQTKRSIFLA